MSIEANKALIRRFVDQVRNGGNLDAIAELAVPNKVDELRRSAVLLTNAFSDYEVWIDELIAEGDRVVMRATQRGIHTGFWFGLPPTGKRVEWTVIRIFRIADGRIADTWFASDQPGLLRQIGAVVVPGPA